MKKTTILAALAALPLAALAQGGPGPGPGAGPGPGGKGGPGDARWVEKVEKRMRLARTLGLAEALDLDAPQALKLGEAVSRFDDRRLAAHRQVFDAHQTLRRAAQGEKVAPAEVDQAIQQALDARAQLQAIDKETLAALTKDLSPEKRARAFLFLEKFKGRFGPGMGPGDGMGPGMGPAGRRGGGRGRGPGPGGPGGGMGFGPGPGPGPGPMMGMGPGECPNPDCPWEED